MGNVGDIFPVADECVFDGTIVSIAQAHSGNQDLIIGDTEVREDWSLKLNPGCLRASMQAKGAGC